MMAANFHTITLGRQALPVIVDWVHSGYIHPNDRYAAAAALFSSGKAALPTVILYLIFQRRVAQGIQVAAGLK